MRKIRKSCPLCNHPDRDNLEIEILDGRMEANALDREEGWRAGTTRKHMQEHLNAYHDDSNDKCALCVASNRKDLEAAIVDGHMKPSKVAAYLEVGVDSINLHMKKHLKPIVQQSAALDVARVELNEIDLLSQNVSMLQGKIQQFILDNEDLDFKTVDSLVKLSKEIRESLKYALEFKGKLVHKREETVVIKQIEVIQKVLIERYPEVWTEIRDDIAERLQ